MIKINALIRSYASEARLPDCMHKKEESMRTPGISPIAREAMAYVLAGGRGSRLMELTAWRAKPAVSFGGKSRIGFSREVSVSIVMSSITMFWSPRPVANTLDMRNAVAPSSS